MRVAENLLGAGVIEPELARERPETFFRPLSRLSPELQIVSMELVQKLEPVPDTALVTEVVGCVRGSQEPTPGIMSGTNSATMRYRRVYSNGIPQLAAALEAGLLTPYRAGEIARLEPQAQQTALTIWTTRARQKQLSAAIAAVALRQYLAGSSRVDLDEACSAIRGAVEELRQNQL